MTGLEQVFVYYPRGDRTGGPEALHQLVDALRTVGFDAYLVPTADTAHLPRVEQYERYDAPEAPAVRDVPGAAVVFPEVFLSPITDLVHARPVCWWLSIDKSALFSAPTERDNRRLLGDPSDTRLRLRCLKQAVVRRRWLPRMADPRVSHVAQSEYARRFLVERHGFEARLVSDYLPHVEADAADVAPPRVPAGSRPTVSYQPAKGGPLAAAVRAHVGEDRVRWVPIQGMDAGGVRQALQESSVFLDLGHQPGKDRLPREAALAGAVSVVANVGAGSNDVDMPLPDAHKIAYTPAVVRDAADAVLAVLTDVDGAYAQQARYRAGIRDERRRFHDEVRTAFGAM